MRFITESGDFAARWTVWVLRWLILCFFLFSSERKTITLLAICVMEYEMKYNMKCKRKLLGALLVCLCPLQEIGAQDSDNLELYRDEYARAVKMGNRDSLAAACCHLSEFYSFRDADSTRRYCLEGLQFVNKQEKSPYIELLNNLGYYYSFVGDIRKSIDVLLGAWKEGVRLGADETMVGDILSSVGVGYRRINDVDSALYFYKEAMTYYQKDEETACDNVSFLLANIAVLYANSSRVDEAESYIRKAMERIKESDDLDTRLYVSNTAGAIFTLQQKHEEAEKVMMVSLDWARRDKKPRFILQCMSPLLSLYHRTGNKKGIDRLVNEAQPLMALLPANSSEVLGVQETLAIIFYEGKRFKESAELYLKQLKVYEKSSQTPLEKIYLGLARNYSGMNKVKEAADYYERAYETIDSIYHSNVADNLSEFTVKYETQQKELEIAQLNETRLEQRNVIMWWTLIAGFLGVLFVIGIVYEAFRRRQRKHEKELDMARSFIDGLEKERARLAKELHDGICNDLLGIGMMLNLKGRDTETNEAIAKSVEAIRTEVRAISHELTPPKFQHASVDEIVESMLEGVFGGQTVEFAFDKQGDATLWKAIPRYIAYEVYRIIQELSSNIAFHSGAKWVKVRMTAATGRLDILIANDGKEFDAVPNGRHGMGLSTIEERVKTIHADYSMEYVNGEQLFKLHVGWRNHCIP